MGNAQASSIGLLADQESEAEPGSRCIVTVPFDSLDPPVTVSQGFESLELFLRQPLLNGGTTSQLAKYVDVVEKGPDEFFVKVCLNGDRLEVSGDGRGDACDLILMWTQYKIDRGANTIVLRSFVDELNGGTWADRLSVEDPVMVMRYSLHGLSLPERIEICADSFGRPDPLLPRPFVGNRRADPEFLDRIQARVNLILKLDRMRRASTVQMMHDLPSIRDPDMTSHVSSPITDVSREQLFDAMVGVLKNITGTYQEARVLEDSVSKYVFDCFMPDVHDARVRMEVDFRRQLGEIYCHEVAVDKHGCVAMPPWSSEWGVVIHEDPVVVESWDIDESGERVTTALSARNTQSWVNRAMRNTVG